jgi:acyl dehydratase
MALNTDIIGTEWDAGESSWTSKDALLYALGVGAGSADPLEELAFTTENSHQVPQKVLPTFASVVPALRGKFSGPSFGDFPLEAVLHAEQGVTLFSELPVEATVSTRATVKAIYDKGRDALIVTENVSTDVASGKDLFATRSGIFVRGKGGFGGERGASQPWELPGRPADHVVDLGTKPDQALIYRLSGDRNPLHSDPWFAKKAGFDRPILHGQCTYGLTGRALLSALCGNDPARFGSMSARFSAVTFPGRRLRVEIWVAGTVVQFRTLDGGSVVLDRGLFNWADHG